MLHLLWGFKTHALFDLWSFTHFLSGISIGALVILINRRMVHTGELDNKADFIAKHYINLISMILLAFLWETIEHYLELGLIGTRVAFWFAGQEFWANRFLTDPIMLVLGYFVAFKFPKLAIPAKILATTWLLIHVFIFPHSMYLQEVF